MTTTGNPGRKRTGIGGASLERVQHEAQAASDAAVLGHELLADPHPQYTTDAEAIALILANAPVPRFATFWKWG